MSTNAVIYARYSSASQREASIEDQIRICKEYAANNNLVVIQVYSDYAVSATTDDRANFQVMIKQAAKKLFSEVLIYKNDRFARNRFDAAIYKKKLKDYGVKVSAVMEPIPDGPGGIVMEALYESMAEMYSVNLSENIRRGQYGNAKKCLANCMAPFGYKIDQATRRYIIDETKAPALKQIFAMAAAGQTYDQIRDFMISQGLPHSPNWLYKTFANRRYLGIYIYNDVEVPGGMPQLIDQKTFDDVRARSAKRRHTPSAKPDRYLLSCKMFCGYCGEMMRGVSGVGKGGGEYRYYKCTMGRVRHNCSHKPVPAIKAEQMVLEGIKSKILQDDVIERLAVATIDYQQQVWEEESNCPTFKAELAETEKRLKNMTAAIEMGVVTETTTRRLHELEDQKNKLLSLIAAEQLNKPTLTKKDIVDWLSSYKKGDVHDIKYAAMLLDTFASQVYAFDDCLILKFTIDKKAQTRLDLDLVRGLYTDTHWWR